MMYELKRDISDVRSALKKFAPRERKENSTMMWFTAGAGRPANSLESFERIIKRLEELEAKLGSL